jgi:hypothetical protein
MPKLQHQGRECNGVRAGFRWESRFWRKVNSDTPNGCWLWTASKTHNGYGQFNIGGGTNKMVRVHRLVFESYVSLIPNGLQIDHVCRNRACVNPSHLRLATPFENAQNHQVMSRNTSGFKGVSFRPSIKQWQAQIAVNGNSYHLGWFDSPDLAHAAYCDAAVKYHGEFANFGGVA